MAWAAEAGRLVDRLSPAAELIGACNTVVMEEDGTLTGHNTDGIGFVRNLKEHGVEVKGQRIVILGTGGAATAITVQAALDGAAQIAIFNRKGGSYSNGEETVEKIRRAVPDISRVYIEDIHNRDALKEAIAGNDLLVNATSLGMCPMEKETPVPAEYLHPVLAVADVVYNPRETRLLREAKEAGCRAVVDGTGMLLWQGAEAFRLFTGQEMPAEEVRERFFAE